MNETLSYETYCPMCRGLSWEDSEGTWTCPSDHLFEPELYRCSCGGSAVQYEDRSGGFLFVCMECRDSVN